MSKTVIWVLAVLASAGFGIAATAVIYMFSGLFLKNRANKFKAVEDFPEEGEKSSIYKKLFSDKQTLFFMGGGAFLFGLVTVGTRLMLPLMIIGAAAGLVGRKALERVFENRNEFIKTKEVSLLYECVDLFSNAGYTVKQSLKLSMILVPNLRKNISNCIDRYPSGPLRALDQLGRDIGVKQADMLSGLLMQAEESGIENIKGIMEQEAVRLEELRGSLAESRIAAKPIYSAVYLFLPVASVLGIIIAPLAYRAIQMITGIHAGT